MHMVKQHTVRRTNAEVGYKLWYLSDNSHMTAMGGKQHWNSSSMWVHMLQVFSGACSSYKMSQRDHCSMCRCTGHIDMHRFTVSNAAAQSSVSEEYHRTGLARESGTCADVLYATMPWRLQERQFGNAGNDNRIIHTSYISKLTSANIGECTSLLGAHICIICIYPKHYIASRLTRLEVITCS